jgi:restriction endonuclease S subunit
MTGSAGQQRVPPDFVRSYELPLPPLDEQERIVSELEGYRKVIEGARQILASYKPTIRIDPGWPVKPLGAMCTIKSGGTPDRSKKEYWGGSIPWVTTTLIDYEVIRKANECISPLGLENSACWMVPKGTILMAMYGQGVTRGRVAVLGIDAAINQACAAFLITNNAVLSEYLFEALRANYGELRRISDARGGNQSNLSAQVLKDFCIPLPPLAIQRQIVAELEAERKLVEANRELIARMEAKIKAKLAEVWGETGNC